VPFLRVGKSKSCGEFPRFTTLKVTIDPFGTLVFESRNLKSTAVTLIVTVAFAAVGALGAAGAVCARTPTTAATAPTRTAIRFTQTPPRS